MVIITLSGYSSDKNWRKCTRASVPLLFDSPKFSGDTAFLNSSCFWRATVLVVRRRKTSPDAIPRTRPLGLSRAMSLDIFIPAIMLSGTWARASLEAALKRRLKAVSSSRHNFKYSLRLPVIPPLSPRRDERRTSLKSCLSNSIGASGTKDATLPESLSEGSTGLKAGSRNSLAWLESPGPAHCYVTHEPHD